MEISTLLFFVVVVPVTIFGIYVHIQNKKEPNAPSEDIPMRITVPASVPASAVTTPDEDAPADSSTQAVVREPIDVVVSVKLIKTVKGKALMTIASIMTVAAWAFFEFYLTSYDKTLGDQIYLASFFNPFNLLRIAALVSAVSWWFDDSACMLLAGIALIGAVLADFSMWFLLVPAMLFFFASERLAPKYSIETTTKQV